MEHTVVEFKIRGWDVDSAKKIIEILKGFEFIKEFDKIYRQKDMVRVRLDRNDGTYLIDKLVKMDSKKIRKLGEKIEAWDEAWDEGNYEDDNLIALVKSFEVWGSIYFEL